MLDVVYAIYVTVSNMYTLQRTTAAPSMQSKVTKLAEQALERYVFLVTK